jgi:hypothetical protein
MPRSKARTILMLRAIWFEAQEIAYMYWSPEIVDVACILRGHIELVWTGRSGHLRNKHLRKVKRLLDRLRSLAATKALA